MKESTKRLVDDLENELRNKINENDKYIEKKAVEAITSAYLLNYK